MAIDKTDGKIKEHRTLLLCVDGGCEPKNPGGIATYGWVIYDKNNRILVEDCDVAQDGGPLATNNFAEYCALGFALKWLREQNWRGNLTIQGDSQLLIYQVTEKWQCKAKHLQPLRKRIWEHLEALNLDWSLDDGGHGDMFTCTGCNHKGDINTLIDIGDGLQSHDMMCPMCHSVAIVFDAPDDSSSSNKGSCVLKWVPREQNAYADELSNRAYRGHVRNKKERGQM